MINKFCTCGLGFITWVWMMSIAQNGKSKQRGDYSVIHLLHCPYRQRVAGCGVYATAAALHKILMAVISPTRNGMVTVKEWMTISSLPLGGGMLLKPSSLYQDLTNFELTTKLIPTADDIWLNAVCRLAGVLIDPIKGELILSVKGTQELTISSVNNGESQNDR